MLAAIQETTTHAPIEHAVRSCCAPASLVTPPKSAAGVLTRVAGLLESDADGVLRAHQRGAGEARPLTVMAGTGSLRRLHGSVLGGAGDARACEAIRRTLELRASVFALDFATLHFGGTSSRNFAAFIWLARPLGEIEKSLLEVFCKHVAIGLVNVELVSDLHAAAFYDQLSTLPNRTRLIKIVDATLVGPDRASATLALVDLDHFAKTNDTLGHQFGDLLLAVAARLQVRLGRHLTVARFACPLHPDR